MNYQDFETCVKNFEENLWFGEYVYFKAIEMLEDVRADLSRINCEEHLKKIVRMFLVQWGSMGRTAFRKDIEWENLACKLRGAKDVFARLQGKSLLDIDFNDKETVNIIKRAYNAVRTKCIGPTATSKILHLLNPELFVMWDYEIRKDIKKKIRGYGGSFPATAEGYVEFLKFVKEEIEDALNKEATKKGCSTMEIVETICRELPHEKHRLEYGKKTLAKLIDEYNWWKVREE